MDPNARGAEAYRPDGPEPPVTIREDLMEAAVQEIAWARRGACRAADPDLFFPLAPSPQQEARAKAICAGCQVLADCRAYALRAGEPDGIWGGLTPEERRRLRFPEGWRRGARGAGVA
ncbi:WhiB family redox-sensing transcriptional regulator [Thermocatellispora tengchongensis]|uniref:Transcriptional regulator WhiB n=1 Tax=Thermocatellispora tengchongensis TaxID=1073253 RepID=A0A840PJM3_9ACTN|nr:WhiB family redox-sensing transcriptional regulator [Thermocatellispora tengchongensis]